MWTPAPPNNNRPMTDLLMIRKMIISKINEEVSYSLISRELLLEEHDSSRKPEE